jgi:hypothetical protein
VFATVSTAARPCPSDKLGKAQPFVVLVGICLAAWFYADYVTRAAELQEDSRKGARSAQKPFEARGKAAAWGYIALRQLLVSVRIPYFFRSSAPRLIKLRGYGLSPATLVSELCRDVHREPLGARALKEQAFSSRCLASIAAFWHRPRRPRYINVNALRKRRGCRADDRESLPASCS